MLGNDFGNARTLFFFCLLGGASDQVATWRTSHMLVWRCSCSEGEAFSKSSVFLGDIRSTQQPDASTM